jgi:hypothetical protein
MLDQDLAALYGVPTKRLNEQVRRNINRFPEDFAFQLNTEEAEFLRSQIVTSSSDSLRSQIATLDKGRGKHRKYLPYVFTEQGVAMLSSVLRSERAVAVNIEIMRAFVRMRHFLESNKELAKAVTDLRSFVLRNSNKVDQEFRRVWKEFERRSAPPANTPRIGFRLD